MANQSVCTSCDLVCVSSDEKGISRWDFPCIHRIFLTSLSETIQDENSCSLVGSCQVSIVSRHGFTQKEHTNNHKVVAELGYCVVKNEDLMENKVPREWVLLENFNPNDE